MENTNKLQTSYFAEVLAQLLKYRIKVDGAIFTPQDCAELNELKQKIDRLNARGCYDLKAWSALNTIYEQIAVDAVELFGLCFQ